MESMSTEELLKPRYKVIADFWDNPFEIGTILIFEFLREPFMPPIEELESGNVTQYLYTDFIPFKDGGSCSYAEIQFSKYPHLFKKLEWWEERDVKDLLCVKYVKRIGKYNNGEILTVAEPKYDFREWHVDGQIEFWFIKYSGYLPITEQEYNDYKSKQK